jgi:hypothetical protein
VAVEKRPPAGIFLQRYERVLEVKDMSNRDEEAMPTSYRAPDGSEGRVFPTRYATHCRACSKAIEAGAKVVGIAPGEPANPNGPWMVLHTHCAVPAGLEPVTEQPIVELFKRKHDESPAKDEALVA